MSLLIILSNNFGELFWMKPGERLHNSLMNPKGVI